MHTRHVTFKLLKSIPVVISADLIMEEVHRRCTDLMNAAAPVTCGQDIEVPDFMENVDGFFPFGTVPVSFSGAMAAKMATPGAIISG